MLRLLTLTLLISACGTPDPPPTPDAAASAPTDAPVMDPDLVVATAEESVRLGDHRGDVLVLQLAPAAAAGAWAALDDAHADLAAEGATVIGLVTDGRLDGDRLYPVRHTAAGDWSSALGYQGAPLTVVIGPAGRLRGRSADMTGDAIVAVAAPVLLEAEAAAPALDVAPALTADAVEALVRDGAALIDVRPTGEPLAHALAIPLASLRPDVLPPDPGVAVVFVGPDAAAAAEQAAAWGHTAALALEEATGLELAPDVQDLPVYDARDDLPRVRG